jgi:plastocyanin
MSDRELLRNMEPSEEPSNSERRGFLKQVATAAVVAGAAAVFAEPASATNGESSAEVENSRFQDIHLRYNEATWGVTVTPDTVHKGTTVRFVNPDGGKVRVVFLSPRGNEVDAVKDSESCLLAIGGSYHFKCFFLPEGATREIAAATGGFIDVIPHRP